VRLRLTVLYGCLFLVSGAALLAITNALVRHATSGPIISDEPGFTIVVPKATDSPRGVATLRPAQAQSGLRGQPSPQLRQFIDQALHQQSTELHQLLIGSEIALGVISVISIALGWIVAGRVIHPLRVITVTARKISAANMSERLAFGGPKDELRELADTFDELLGRLEASLLAHRRFAANASHELRGPLARQRTLIQVALADPDATAESLRAAHERVLVACAQQSEVIDALLTLARVQPGISKCEPVDLADLAGEVLPSREVEAARLGLKIQTVLRTAPSTGDPRLVECLISNLVDNALRHNVHGGWIEVQTETRAGRAIISVANTGDVVPASVIDELFQPFQRLAADRADRHEESVGLGLSIVEAIAEAHDSILTVHPREEGGLYIESSFPAAISARLVLALSAGPIPADDEPPRRRRPGRTVSGHPTRRCESRTHRIVQRRNPRDHRRRIRDDRSRRCSRLLPPIVVRVPPPGQVSNRRYQPIGHVPEIIGSGSPGR
jgi:signal transduction histidine kinase